MAPRTLILLGGATASGKTTTAAALARQLGAAWLKVDMLWRVIREALPPGSDRELLSLDDHHRLRTLPAAELRDQHLAASRFICDRLPVALQMELTYHETVVADGAWLLPEFVAALDLEALGFAGARKASVFIHEPEAIEVKHAMRNRRGTPVTASWQRGGAAAWALHGDWLAAEARRVGIPVVAARPRETLITRAATALGIAPPNSIV